MKQTPFIHPYYIYYKTNDSMRTKNLILLLSCLLFSSLFYLLLPNFPTKLYSPNEITFSSSSSSSSNGRSNIIHGNSNDLEYYESTSLFNQQQQQTQSSKSSQLIDQLSSISSTESTYLFDQGSFYIDTACKPKYFAENTTFSDSNNNTSLPLPVFISAIESGDGKLAVKFLHKFHATFPNGQLILYSLNIVGTELDLVSKWLL